MPDVDGKVPLDSEGREILNDDGTEGCGCCCCRSDLPSSFILDGERIVKDTTTGDIIADDTFEIELDVADAPPCAYEGAPVSGQPNDVSLQSQDDGIAQGYGVSCYYLMEISDALLGGAAVSVRLGNNPIGAYPDIPPAPSVSPTGWTVEYKNLVVS